MSATIQQIIEPSQIESELLRMWEGLAKENKMRASLFNLIVFNRLSPRTDYIRTIVQKVVEKFPCRTLFISSDPASPHPYLRTAISVVVLQGDGSGIACDQIDIGSGGPDLERIPFLILPHLVPDLPIYLLWTEDPSQPHLLFAPLAKLANRIIFDSESADSLTAFANTILDIKRKTGMDVADLNWARNEGWRNLMASMFNSSERIRELARISHVEIRYNSRETDFFCHLKIQAMYLLAWLASRLEWTFEHEDLALRFQFVSRDAVIQSAAWEQLGPGTLVSIDCHTENGYRFEAGRIPRQPHCVKILISSPTRCDLPYSFFLEQTEIGQSLVKEICNKGTSSHYLSMLETLVGLGDRNIINGIKR